MSNSVVTGHRLAPPTPAGRPLDPPSRRFSDTSQASSTGYPHLWDRTLSQSRKLSTPCITIFSFSIQAHLELSSKDAGPYIKRDPNCQERDPSSKDICCPSQEISICDTSTLVGGAHAAAPRSRNLFLRLLCPGHTFTEVEVKCSATPVYNCQNVFRRG